MINEVVTVDAGPAVAELDALITAARSGPENYQVADLTGGQDLELVIRAQAVVAGVLLDVLAPDSAPRSLRHLGLTALEQASR